MTPESIRNQAMIGMNAEQRAEYLLRWAIENKRKLPKKPGAGLCAKRPRLEKKDETLGDLAKEAEQVR